MRGRPTVYIRYGFKIAFMKIVPRKYKNLLFSLYTEAEKYAFVHLIVQPEYRGRGRARVERLGEMLRQDGVPELQIVQEDGALRVDPRVALDGVPHLGQTSFF